MDAIKTGALIAQARKDKDLTQGQLAQLLHVSTQAVSKWERGLNFPDITLLEPLGDALELTTSELLTGTRNAPAEEELVRASLRVSLAQLGPKVRRWRGLFWAVALCLLLVAAMAGYAWVRDNTTWLPQRETVVSPIEASRSEKMLYQVAGMGAIGMFDVAFADDSSGWRLEWELWDQDGLRRSWPLLAASGLIEDKNALRHQSVALSVQLGDDQVKYSVLAGGAYTQSTLEDFPIRDWKGFSWNLLHQPTTLSREEGVVLASFGLDLGSGILADNGLGSPGIPGMRPGHANLLLRLTCIYD